MPASRVFYFDIDGTVVHAGTGSVKPALAGGALERAVRAAQFQRLVCVSSAITVIQQKQALGIPGESHPWLFDVCDGAFSDLDWFTRTVELADDPGHRVELIDTNLDWYYADDAAEPYSRRSGLLELFNAEKGKRIHVAEPGGDGSRMLAWLQRLVPVTG